MTVDDADAIARAVGESLEHLKPWMPWADARSADADVPAEPAPRPAAATRTRRGMAVRDVRATDDAFLGSIGLMTRRGPGTLEIGYWLHVDAGNRGLATSAAARADRRRRSHSTASTG